MIYADPIHRYKTVLSQVPMDSELCLDIGGFSSGIYFQLFSEFGLNVESVNLIRNQDLNNIPTYVVDFFNFLSPKKYDYTFLIDVIEHVNDNVRVKMVEKAIQLAQKGSFILFPYKCKENLELEAKIIDLFLKNNYEIKSSLKEHLEYGLPEINTIFNHLNRNKISYSFQYVTDRTMFYELFEKQFMMEDENERLKFCFEQSQKLNRIRAVDYNTNKYRIFLKVFK